MAVALTMTDWRKQIGAHPERPDALTNTQLKRLSEDARFEYDESRRAWIAAGQMVPTYDFEQIKRLARLVVSDSTYGATTARSALSVSGSAGMGKTSALQSVARDHELHARERRGLPLTDASLKEHGREVVHGFLPVVYVVLPSSTTPKALMETFMTFLGLPVPPRTTTVRLTSIVTENLRALGTSMVVVDDLHRLRTRTSAGGESANALKSFAEGLDAAFMFAGIDLPESELFHGPAGEQLYDRTTPYVMRGFSYSTDDRQLEWTDLVARLEALLPLVAHERGTLPALSEDLMYVTSGSLGRLRRILRLAANQAINDGTESVTAETLHSITADFPLQSRSGRSRSRHNGSEKDAEEATG